MKTALQPPAALLGAICHRSWSQEVRPTSSSGEKRLVARTSRLRLGLLRLAARAFSRLTHAPPSAPQRVLLLRPDHVGDVLLTAPAVALLRASLPDAQLTYLVGPWSLQAAAGGPAVDSLRTLAYPGFTRRTKPNLLQPYTLLAREAARLRKERYDLAVVFRPDHWWGALLALVAGIPTRVGGHTPETEPLLTHAYAGSEREHAAAQALSMTRLALEAVGVAAPTESYPTKVPFEVSQAARIAAQDLWRQRELDTRTVVAIHPSSGAPLKSWPIDNWAALADALIAEGLSVMMTGAPDDGPLLSGITGRMTHRPELAVGQALDVSAAIYARCALVVSVDSGAAHLAAAVSTPTVRLYGPAPPEVFGPWPPGADQRVLNTTALSCAPCGHLEAPPCGARSMPACMLAVGVDDMLNAVQSELDRMVAA